MIHDLLSDALNGRNTNSSNTVSFLFSFWSVAFHMTLKAWNRAYLRGEIFQHTQNQHTGSELRTLPSYQAKSPKMPQKTVFLSY